MDNDGLFGVVVRRRCGSGACARVSRSCSSTKGSAHAPSPALPAEVHAPASKPRHRPGMQPRRRLSSVEFARTDPQPIGSRLPCQRTAWRLPRNLGVSTSGSSKAIAVAAAAEVPCEESEELAIETRPTMLSGDRAKSSRGGHRAQG